MHTIRLVLVVFVSIILEGCAPSSPPRAGLDGEHSDASVPSSGQAGVRIIRTELGIPHITASDYLGLGSGIGYAFAEDNLCVLQEDLVTVRGERARYLGRDGTYTIQPTRTTTDNVTSDFFWRFMATDEAIARLRSSTDPEFRDATTGFVAGYNRYLRELKGGQHPGRHTACRDAAWLFEISEPDMYRRYYRLLLLASSSVFVPNVVAAGPPAPGEPVAAPSPPALEALSLEGSPLAAFSRDRELGSNMYALSKDATADGRSILFGNPHFPWIGTERLWISHLTIPGVLDIMGSSLHGVPAILIGFNEHVAWSHTVSTAFRFTFYELTLDPSDPTKYVYEGQSRPMTAVPLTIDVLEGDGTTTQESRTLYRSHYGPMLELSASGVPVLPWTRSRAYTLRDANAENDRAFNQFSRWNRARSLDELIALHKEVLGIPWVNTIATGPDGRAYYGDVSVVPNVPDAKVASCATSPVAIAIGRLVPGLPVLDGSRAACEWDTDADAPAPGIFGPGNLPTLERTDWVHNCNDSYWLTNPAEPITGYARIVGDEGTARTLRTRLCILQVLRGLEGGRRLDVETLKREVLSSHVYSAELGRDDLIADVCATPVIPTREGPVDVTEACAVLRAWDLSGNLDARGAHVWRELWSRAAAASGGPWQTGFSTSDPVNTPRDLHTDHPQVREAFGLAVRAILSKKIPLDARVADLQRPEAIDPSIPIFGATHGEGAFTIVSVRALTDAGYRVWYGNSYLQVVTWDDLGPVADGFLTYSQSTDPASPHFSDFTRRYSEKRWHRFPFHRADIDATRVRETLLSAR